MLGVHALTPLLALLCYPMMAAQDPSKGAATILTTAAEQGSSNQAWETVAAVFLIFIGVLLLIRCVMSVFSCSWEVEEDSTVEITPVAQAPPLGAFSPPAPQAQVASTQVTAVRAAANSLVV